MVFVVTALVVQSAGQAGQNVVDRCVTGRRLILASAMLLQGVLGMTDLPCYHLVMYMLCCNNMSVFDLHIPVDVTCKKSRLN